MDYALGTMPSNLTRYQHSGQLHFVTFSCYERAPLLSDVEGYTAFEHELERVRARYKFVVAGYVLMPEHVHLLMSEPGAGSMAIALQVLKQQTSRTLKLWDATQFWHRRYFDFNVFSERKTTEKLKYMHRNPVKRGLVQRPEDWPWSSFRHYATGEVGIVEIESRWTAERRSSRRELTDKKSVTSHP